VEVTLQATNAIMKRPATSVASRKILPSREANPSRKVALMKKPARRRRVLKKGSDEELVRVFGEK